MVQLFHTTSENCSRIVTESYSTSFASAIRLLHKDLRAPIFNIYGFVRFADEIVDTFHDHDKKLLLDNFRDATRDAIRRGISLNPILNSFQLTVNEYKIEEELISAFFNSMETDLEKRSFDCDEYREYIYGSAEVVGLMCLRVFCSGDEQKFNQLRTHARALGAAFQKVNFLRDIKSDKQELSRMYFPGCNFNDFSSGEKKAIEADIENDFSEGYKGVLLLPEKARFGVYVAYKYYYSLFNKIRRMQPAVILEQRVRIPAYRKALILLRASVKNQLRLI